MSAHSMAAKFRRALRNQTGAHFSYAELVELVEFGALIPWGLFPTGYTEAPRPPIVGHWPEGEVVYFVGPENGPVKIGYASNLRARFNDLKYMSPVPIHVWGYSFGSMQLEKEYHARFKSCRLHGEWFERTAELVAEIERIWIPEVVT